MSKKIPLVSIKMVREKSLPQLLDSKITSPQVAYDLIRNLIEDKDRECFVVLALDTSHSPNYVEIVSQGTVNNCLVYPRDVFKSALLSNSCKLFIAHNHPSGSTTPSEADIDLTRRLENGGDLLGISIIDHLIIGQNKYFSFREQGLLQESNSSTLTVNESEEMEYELAYDSEDEQQTNEMVM